MRSGPLNNLLQIQSPATGTDELGQPVIGWIDFAQVWGNIRHLRGVESIKSGAITSVVSASIRIRFRNDINAGMRVLAGSVVYEIKAVLPEMGRREFVDIVAELVA